MSESELNNKKQKVISIVKAEQNNLKSISVDIPRNQLTVVTGVSGSGKSTFAFDTLYAEGQRLFIESLSSYARQFLERLGKPKVESISGIPPAIAIKQKKPFKNQRSTVGTITEIYDYLRVLFARIGNVVCSNCGEPIQKYTVTSIVNELEHWEENDKIYIVFPVNIKHFENNIENIKFAFEQLRKDGYNRIVFENNNDIVEYDENLIPVFQKQEKVYFVVDRLKISSKAENISRLNDSIEIALRLGRGKVQIRNLSKNFSKNFSSLFECDNCGKTYSEPHPNLFSFNNPQGACPHCNGLGELVDYEESLVIPNKYLSISDYAVAPFREFLDKGENEAFFNMCIENKINIKKEYYKLPKKQKEILWEGNGEFIGIIGYLRYLEQNKKTNAIGFHKYKLLNDCQYCKGSRLNEEARSVFINGKTIADLSKMSIGSLYKFLTNLNLNEYEKKQTEPVMIELLTRTKMLCDIGLDYLSISRVSYTLSGGEYQRINLATALASSLIGTLYVLDEPSIGLHTNDTHKLIKILHRLRDIGNTIVVVEHDADIISSADLIIDIGPGAGEKGGNIVYKGDYKNFLKSSDSITAKYINLQNNNKNEYNNKKFNRSGKKHLTIYNATENNLKIDELSIPLNCISIITGVSGSGKSTLVNNILYAGIKRMYGMKINNYKLGSFDRIDGVDYIDNIELIDQTQIGQSTRSIPITYLNIFDNIRDVFAETVQARQMGMKSSFFSFNMPGGRCETCEGTGFINIDMQFLPDVEVVCETCGGKRYNKEAQKILYNNKSIVDVLNMSVDEAIEFFIAKPKIVNKLQILKEIGLGYLKLGQPTSTLSGGEAQRIKLAACIDPSIKSKNLYIFDEPTTGLHLADIDKLLYTLRKLVQMGNSILIIEHNLTMIANADWIIDLGPGAGEKGGRVVGEGTPLDIAKLNTPTGKALKKFIS